MPDNEHACLILSIKQNTRKKDQGNPCLQDKINAFWEISKKELEDTKAQLRNKDREMEELEERHQIEIKVLFSLAGDTL